MGRTVAGLLFFALGLHHAVIRAFATSLQTHPAGSWALGPGIIEPVIRLFQVMLSTGLRLAMPVIVSMVLIDIASGSDRTRQLTPPAPASGVSGKAGRPR